MAVTAWFLIIILRSPVELGGGLLAGGLRAMTTGCWKSNTVGIALAFRAFLPFTTE